MSGAPTPVNVRFPVVGLPSVKTGDGVTMRRNFSEAAVSPDVQQLRAQEQLAAEF